MITTILVALDSTARAAEVLRAASELAERFDARLFLFRAITVPPEFPAAAAHATGDDPLPTVLCEQALRELEALARGHERATVERPLVGTGLAWRAILTASDALGADLVVVGGHRRHGMDWVLGTTAVNVVNHARTHVFIVNEPPPR